MKILVDKIVTTPKQCSFAIYHSYPLIADKPGYYICDFDRTECKLDPIKKECNCFKELKNE